MNDLRITGLRQSTESNCVSWARCLTSAHPIPARPAEGPACGRRSLDRSPVDQTARGLRVTGCGPVACLAVGPVQIARDTQSRPNRVRLRSLWWVRLTLPLPARELHVTPTYAPTRWNQGREAEVTPSPAGSTDCSGLAVSSDIDATNRCPVGSRPTEHLVELV